MSARPTPARSLAASAGAAAASKAAAVTSSASARRLTVGERTVGPDSERQWGGSAEPLHLENLHVGVVADHEAVRLRQRGAAADLHVLADQAGLDPILEMTDRRASEHDRVLQLGARDLHVLRDRGVGPDVGVGDAAP